MIAPARPAGTRLYENGRVVAEDFGVDQATAMLAEHPDAVLWLDLYRPSASELAAVADAFRLHPLAVEDAGQDHERPRLDHYPGHLFLNTYAVTPAGTGFEKHEISAFITERALITVCKSPIDTDRFVKRWDADAGLGAEGRVAFLVYGMLDVVVNGFHEMARALDTGMDGVEDAMLDDGCAPRTVRRRGVEMRKTLATLRRTAGAMPELVATAMSDELGIVDEQLMPYYRDVRDNARQTVEQLDFLRERIECLLQADLAEQGNVLNDTTRKLAAWAAIIAVPTAVTGYFGQNIPFPGYEQSWGFLLSLALLVVSAATLYRFLKGRGWL